MRKQRLGQGTTVRLMAVMAVVLGLVFGTGEMGPAVAALNQRTPVTDWYSSDYNMNFGNHRQIEIGLYMERFPTPRAGQVEPGVFYLNQFYSHGSGGYVGFQVLPRGEKKILFSWWDAIGVYCSGVTNLVACGKFHPIEGNGYTVQWNMPDFALGHEYRFRVRYGWEDAGGRWWNADLIDTYTGQVRPMGSIKVPLSQGWLQGAVAEINEYFAWQRTDACRQVPYSDVWRGAPLFDGKPPASHVNHYRGTVCFAHGFDWNGGVVQRFGAR